MQMLMGGSRKHVDDTQTMIVVGINRLRDEYDLGKADQMKDEHWRKQVRIMIGLGVTGFSIVGSLLGFETAPFAALFVHCLIHVIL